MTFKSAVSIPLLIALLALSAFAQIPTTSPPVTPNDFVGAGLAYNQYASPQVNGLVVYAHKLAGTEYPTYSFTAVDFVSAKTHPFSLSTVTETGVAQYLHTVGPFDVYGLAMAGVAMTATPTGTSLGAAFSGGGLAQARIGKSGWSLGPYVRIVKPNPADTQYAVGLLVGWGK